MTQTLPRHRSSNMEVSVAQATLAGLVALGLFCFLKVPKCTLLTLERMSLFSDKNETTLIIFSALVLFNFILLAAAIQRAMKVKVGSASRKSEAATRTTIPSLAAPVLFCLVLSGAAIFLSFGPLELHRIDLLPFALPAPKWGITLAVLGATSGVGLGVLLQRLKPISRLGLVLGGRLPDVPHIQDGIVLGAVHETENSNESKANQKNGHFPNWILLGLKGLTGNLFIAGVIGSGKSQILLQFLRQILGNLVKRPALLAIDPKRTFVRELKKIIELLGLKDHLVWVSLEGETRMNPIWREGMLKNSAFTTIANSLKLASINFIGSSGESRFWEQSSFNLLKACLIYCAARFEYFTFKELYRALVQARDEGLAGVLVDCLNAKQWDTEERANIEMAIDYFKDEFSQMDEKVRTSILATATSFLNEFLEYRVSRILSPSKEEINMPSMAAAIQEGKLICLHIENDSLARSIGTLIKLLFQEAVLDRVSDPNHADARYAVLVMDEFQDVATSGGGAGLGDDRYLAKARESKAITIAATQSVSSLENAIRSEPATRELLQNFRSRIFGNTTDPKTIRLFQEPRGQEETQRSSHSFSETSPDARRDLIFGGYDSQRSNISEGVSTQLSREFPVTAKEFARLRTFEAFAQIFDGLETSFEKLFLKPYYLRDLRTPHRKILADLRQSAAVKRIGVKRLGVFWSLHLLFGSSQSSGAVLYPNFCSVVKAPQFRSCMSLSVGACTCGYPPRPCANISYYVPQTFVEVWPNSKQSYFSTMPGTGAQLASHSVSGAIPFGQDDEMSSYSFQAHALAIPMANTGLSALPCGGTRSDKACFDLMSEDLGPNWSTGSADLLQPKFLAWSLVPKVCLLKGAVSGVAGAPEVSLGADSGTCSYPLANLPKYPPSMREACNGWGLFYPRSGIYEGGSRASAALMVAARLKSLGVEVAHTLPGDADEIWQMISPQASACFKEGENPGLLETAKGVREEQRLLGKPNGYLFATWKRVSCCRDLTEVTTTQAALLAISAACQAIPGGE